MQANEEKKQVQKYLNEIDDKNKQISVVQNASLKAQRKLKPVTGGSAALTNEKLKDYILRLKTTSIHTAKYGETLNALLQLALNE